MPLTPQADEVLSVATLRNGKTHVEYSIYDQAGQPPRLEVRKGHRYVLEILDDERSLPSTLPALIEDALAVTKSNGPGADSLTGAEKAVCFFFGRKADWVGTPAAVESRARDLSAGSMSARREQNWRLVRLRGWGERKLLLIVRTQARGHTATSAQSSTQLHTFHMNEGEARAVRDGLAQVRNHPALS